MPAVDPKKVRATAERAFGPLADGPSTFGVLPEGILCEAPDRTSRRLLRAEPCIFLGPPARSKLVIVAAILDRSEAAEDPVRELVSVPVIELGGVWTSGLEDAVTRFPAKEVELTRPELLALEAGSLVWRLGEANATTLPHATPVVAVGRERTARQRRAIVIVRGHRALDPAFYDDGPR